MKIKYLNLVIAGAMATIATIVSLPGVASTLYVGSFNNNSVLRFDGETGDFIDTFIQEGSGGLDGPVGLTFGPQKPNLYVTSIFTDSTPPGQVLQYKGSSGEFIKTFTPNFPSLIFSQDLAFGPNSNLYVTNAGLDTIEEYNGQTGEYIGSLFPANPSICDAPFSITAYGEASLYFSCTFTNNVQRYDLNTGEIELLGNASSDGAAPGGLSIGPDGALYVANFSANTIDRYDLETGAVQVFIDGVDSPVQPVFGPNGDLYVSSNPTQKVGQPVPGRVLRYDGPTGRLVDAQFIPSLSGGLNGAGWIAFTDEVITVPEPSMLLGLFLMALLNKQWLKQE